MDISFFFRPLDPQAYEPHLGASPQSLGSLVDFYQGPFPHWHDADIVLLGVPEDRGTLLERGPAAAPRAIRERLYRLAAPVPGLRLADLGDLAPKDDLDEVYPALGFVLGELLKARKTVVLLGGTHDLVYGQYLGYQELETNIEVVSIDARPDMLDAEVALHHQSHHSQVFMHSPNYLYHFCNLAAQSYYISEVERKTLKAMNFELVRVGELKGNIRRAEPFLRMAHLVSFDMGAIRASDAPGASTALPAGLTTEEACTVARYAGMGYRCSSFGVYELTPANDPRGQTAELGALLAWHFIEGYYNRSPDQPKADRSNLQRYTAALYGAIPEIVFFRSDATDRWWMEVPSPAQLAGKRGPSQLVACTEDDYHTALHNEIPERWWLAHYRF